MKHHLESNHRFPLILLLLLVLVTLLASFYAGSMTVRVFTMNPRAIFEGPFLGIGIGDDTQLEQPGASLVRQCLVCNTNGYCERDLFTNQMSTCQFYSDSLDDKIACNQLCANNQLAAAGKAQYISALGTDGCDGNNTEELYDCTPVDNVIYRSKCPKYSTNWIDINPPCDADSQYCTDKAECKPKKEKACDSDNDTTACFNGKLYNCSSGNQWVADPNGCLNGKVCNQSTGKCDDTLCTYEAKNNGITCQDMGQRKKRQVSCSSDGKTLTKKDCGSEEDCVEGTGCVPFSQSPASCSVNTCTGDRSGYWECDTSSHRYKKDKVSCNGPYCIQPAADKDATCGDSTKSECDQVAVANNERRCSPSSKNPQACVDTDPDDTKTSYKWQDTGEDCASYDPKRTCVAGACVAASTSPPTTKDKCEGQTADCPDDGKKYSTKCEEDSEDSGKYKLNCYPVSSDGEECKDVEKPCEEAKECINVGEDEEDKWEWNDDVCDVDPNADKCEGKTAPSCPSTGTILCAQKEDDTWEPICRVIDESKCSGDKPECPDGTVYCVYVDASKTWGYDCVGGKKAEPTEPPYCVPNGHSGCSSPEQCCNKEPGYGCNGGCCGRCTGDGGGGCNFNPGSCDSYPCENNNPVCCPNGQCKCGGGC